MATLEQIIKQKQLIARDELSLMLAKQQKRRADTRLKIEYGGLIIKSGMDGFNKSTILGALDYVLQLMTKEESYKSLFESIGDNIFLRKD